jgi:hypothetical protein
MSGVIRLIFALIVDLFRSRAALEAEVLALRQQILVLRRGRSTRLPFLATDRLVLGWVCWLFPNARDALAVVRPETVLRWHRAGFQSYWRWKSRRRPGRPAMSAEIRRLIRAMSVANPLWGAPRIHGELLKLGIDVGQTSVAKYTARRRGPPSQGWKTFLRNHADGIAAMDLFVGADHLLATSSLRIADHGPRPATNPVARRYGTPNSGMDCQPTDGGMWLGANPSLSDPRSGCLLRQHIRPTSSLSWHSRSSYVSPLALAERICGTIGRLDPQRMPRPRRGGRRAAPAACVVVLHRLLQRRTNASFIRQGCAGSKDRSARRAHRSASRPGLHHQYVRI